MLTATGQVNISGMRDGEFRPPPFPAESKPLSRLPQNSAQLITSATRGLPKSNLVHLDYFSFCIFFAFFACVYCIVVPLQLSGVGSGALDVVLDGIWVAMDVVILLLSDLQFHPTGKFAHFLGILMQTS